MTTDHTLHWLLLQRLPELTASALRRLARSRVAGPDPESWLHAPPERLRRAGLTEVQCTSIAALRHLPSTAPAWRDARSCRDWLDDRGVRLLSMLDTDYPPLLLEIADPPPLLYVDGAIDCLSLPQLAVVGSRRATRQGEIDAANFATQLAAAGFVVTSGLARGIDGAAHRGALAAGGCTVAVLGCGIDVVYPSRHRRLAAEVRAGGALVSELPPGTPPRGPQFPSRNRIISGLSLGVLVIEARLQSGSLVTARLALEQNREVFAVPGSIHEPASAGTNALIRDGAALVGDVRDIVAELRGWAGGVPSPVARPQPALGPAQANVLAAIGHRPTPLEQILEASRQSLPAVLAILGELELRGLVENRVGSYRRIVA